MTEAYTPGEIPTSKDVGMTVHEVSELTGVSIRALQYYDRIGLLSPSGHTGAGYRLYDGSALERLRQILFFRELEFPLKEIKAIIDNPRFDRTKALEQQITLLKLRKEHIEKLISSAEAIYSHDMEMKTKGDIFMDFSAFDKSKIEEYAAKAKAEWGGTDAYREYEQRSQNRTKEEENVLGAGMMEIFARFGAVRDGDPASREAQSLVKELQSYITGHFYTCTDEILSGLGRMYAAGGEFTDNIDAAGGKGTAEFAGRAIEIFCGKQ